MNAVKPRTRDALRDLLRPLYRAFKRAFRLLVWVTPSVGRLLFPVVSRKTRVLLVYDTSSQPFSIGDLILYQVASLVLCESHRIGAVDMVLLYEPKAPAGSSPVFHGHVNDENVFYHLASVMPVAQVNQKLASLFIYDSRDHLNQLVADNADRYVVWPRADDFAMGEYLSPLVFNEMLRSFHAEFGEVPQLKCRPFLAAWADRFFRLHTRPAVPITVNLRNNPEWHLQRNSHIDAWLEFFAHCESRYRCIFVVICARSEIDDRLRRCANVIVAKDHDTSIEQDLALISQSAMHLGANSGPATMAWFGDKPYLMVNTSFESVSFFSAPGMVVDADPDTRRLWFATPMQRAAKAIETKDLLVRQFDQMWATIAESDWTSQMSDGPDAAGPSAWLR